MVDVMTQYTSRSLDRGLRIYTGISMLDCAYARELDRERYSYSRRLHQNTNVFKCIFRDLPLALASMRPAISYTAV